MKNKIVIVLSLIIVLVAVLSGCKKPDAMGPELYGLERCRYESR